MNIRNEFDYFGLETCQDGHWLHRMIRAVGGLDNIGFTSIDSAGQFLKENFIPIMDSECEYPIFFYGPDKEFRRHPAGGADVTLHEGSISVLRHFQVRTVIVNKVKKVVVDGAEYVREDVEKSYGEWEMVSGKECEVKFYIYRKVIRIY